MSYPPPPGLSHLPPPPPAYSNLCSSAPVGMSQYPQSLTMAYATGMAGGRPWPSSSMPPPHAYSHAAAPPPQPQLQKPPQSNWRNYMQSLGTRLDSLDLSSSSSAPPHVSSSSSATADGRDKPLPSLPLSPPVTPSSLQLPSHALPGYTAQQQWAPLPGRNPAAYGLMAPGSPYRPPPPPPVPPRPQKASSGPTKVHGQGRIPMGQHASSASGTASTSTSGAGSTLTTSSPSAQHRPAADRTAAKLPGRLPKAAGSATLKSKVESKTAVIDLTGASDSDDSYSPSDSDDNIPPRRAQHARAHSAQPRLQRITPSGQPRTQKNSGSGSGSRSSSGGGGGTNSGNGGGSGATLAVSSKRHARRTSAPAPTPSTSTSAASPSTTTTTCAGFTRAGAPCKRVVKAAAPFLRHASDESDENLNVAGRYCKDHAGLMCAAAGFYWRDARGKAGVWIQFDDYIPKDLGQQTQALLRMTMESPLTANELPGFLYAYEIRALTTRETSYFKVGRTDNVPRRLGQWTTQCTSHAPTLRDIFPLKPTAAAGLRRQPSAPGSRSLLPGAVNGGVNANRMLPAVKRWERLVHLELGDRAATLRGSQYDDLAKPCADCGAIHKEIFPLADGGGLAAYENVVVDAVERWEAFIRAICD